MVLTKHLDLVELLVLEFDKPMTRVGELTEVGSTLEDCLVSISPAT